MESIEFAVIGAGLSGAATAWQLAAAGHEVAVLERSTPANDAGSSHGSARIFRYAYPDEFYTGLVQEAKAGWDELARLSGKELITPFGAVDYGSVRQPERLAAVLEARGIEHELLSAEEAHSRWPQIAFDTQVLWHPGAGVIDAHESVTAMVDQAVAHGAALHNNWAVTSITASNGGYLITSEDGRTLRSANVVVAAGGWLPKLLGSLALPSSFLANMPQIHVRQEQAYHFPYTDGTEPASWPTFIHKREGFQAYGLPGGRDAGFRGQKVAEYNGGKVLPSAAEQDGQIDPANRRRVVEYVEKYLPGLVPEPYAETTCLFTNTPTEDFILDRADGITILSPCSGHGAKFAPLIGQLGAALATGTGTVPEQFRLAAIGAR
ncbi:MULTISPECIES: FAD-dependent oxidoreductase [Arthrobacter]|uniref:FAD-dependent oxidoreductase n=1 Tax=Arthrobacter terricola TaxID=2547396 RepID=A0A4R5K732_9MICC|nr:MULTISPECIES: FAD-dependent oxidoreductase [Arthrobacter]MBT8163824.1 FAD-dependent oxidoreductase [Arthrobacter sp. GN70]TDF86575.1 FAD-dependent oxidoreductase [Arthrobacter terricola]